MGSSDKIALLGVVVAVVLFVLGMAGTHYHSALRNAEARAVVVDRLRRGHWNAVYHDLLGRLLAWLDRTIDPPLFGRGNGGRRQVGVKSLGVCITLSLFYSIAALLAGWVGGGPNALGDVTLFDDLSWAPAWLLDDGARLLVALLVCMLAGFVSWYLPAALWWSERGVRLVAARFGGHEGHPLRVIAGWFFGVVFILPLVFVLSLGFAVAGDGAATVAVAGAATVAVAGALAVAFTLSLALAGDGAAAGAIVLALTVAGALAGSALAVAGVGSDSREATLVLLFLFALAPGVNGVLDWISLTVSRWFGRGILAERGSPRALGVTVLLALLDLMAAVGFLFATAWLLAGGVEALGVVLGLSLDLEAYVHEAVAHPWSSGLWASFMVLSTLLPTAVHFMLALGAVLFAWWRNPLNRIVADRLDTGNEAYFLWPQVYLTVAWPLMALLTFGALYYGLGGLFMVVIVPLPDALLSTALHGIETARMWFG